MTECILATSDRDYQAAAVLFKEYAAWLNIDLCFQGFDHEISDLKKMYGNKGGIILYQTEGQFVACVAIRKMNDEIAELKRMYVKPAFQKQGLGNMLLEKAFLLAKELDYTLLRLDTLDHMLPAIALYKKYDFYEIPAYYHNPENNALYFEKKL